MPSNSGTCGQKPHAANTIAVITEGDLAEVFGNGAYKLTRSEAAKLLEELTGAHRTSCYRALRLHGRFAQGICTAMAQCLLASSCALTLWICAVCSFAKKPMCCGSSLVEHADPTPNKIERIHQWTCCRLALDA